MRHWAATDGIMLFGELNSFLAKPYNVDQLKAVVGKLLSQ
jgi:hypothetical protein